MAQTLEQVLTPESMQIALAAFEKEMLLEASGTADPDRTRILELEEYKQDGSTVWMEVSLSFLRDKDCNRSRFLLFPVTSPTASGPRRRCWRVKQTQTFV